VTQTEQRRVVADGRRERILTTAARLFRQRGFSGVGMDDIGAAAGLTGPAVYYYFSGKRDLLAAVAGQLVAVLESAVDAAGASAQGAIDRVVAAALAAPDSLAVGLRQLGHLDAEARDPLEARLQAIAAYAAGLGGPGDRVHLRARAVAGAMMSLALAKSPDRATPRALAGEVARSILGTPLPTRSVATAGTARDDLKMRAARAFRSEAILAESARLFHERGFNGVSLGDIGASCGISGSAVARRFGSKERLLAAAFARLGDRIGAATYRALATATEPSRAVEGVIGSYVTAALDSRDLVCLNMSETYHLPAADRRLRRRQQRAYADELAHALTGADPAMPLLEAKRRARAAYSLVSEVANSDELAALEGLDADLTALALAVLHRSRSGRGEQDRP